MRRSLLSLLALVVIGGLFAAVPVPAEAGPSGCGESEVLVRGRLTDEATGLPVVEQHVQLYDSGGLEDETPTNANGRWSFCLVPDDYRFKFVSEDHRTEWWDDQATIAEATVVEVVGPGPIVLNAVLTPRGRVIAGRVTNLNGVPKFASVSIWLQTSAGWRSIDGEASFLPSGWYSYRVPRAGRYRVSADVDHHRSRFAPSARRLSLGRVVTVTSTTTYINNVHVRVPYCPESVGGAFCVPPGFLT